jgi:hypothetical protein
VKTFLVGAIVSYPVVNFYVVRVGQATVIVLLILNAYYCGQSMLKQREANAVRNTADSPKNNDNNNNAATVSTPKTITVQSSTVAEDSKSSNVNSPSIQHEGKDVIVPLPLLSPSETSSSQDIKESPGKPADGTNNNSNNAINNTSTLFVPATHPPKPLRVMSTDLPMEDLEIYTPKSKTPKTPKMPKLQRPTTMTPLPFEAKAFLYRVAEEEKEKGGDIANADTNTNATSPNRTNTTMVTVVELADPAVRRSKSRDSWVVTTIIALPMFIAFGGALLFENG